MLKCEFNIKGMSCSSCSNKVESVLREFSEVVSANVNLITEKALVTYQTTNKYFLDDIKMTLNEIGFEVYNLVTLSDEERENYRVMNVSFVSNEILFKNEELLKQFPGVISVERYETTVDNLVKLNLKIEYDPLIIKGREIYDKLNNHSTSNDDQNLKTSENDGKININEPKSVIYVNSFKSNLNSFNNKSSTLKIYDFVLVTILFSVLLFLTMIPNPLSTVLKSIIIFTPKITLHLILVVLISLSIVIKYGLKMYVKVFRLYKNHKMYNMETLISLGSFSAILLSLVQMFKLITCDEKNSSEVEMNIMMLSHSIEAASAVIAITLIGKHFEEKAKNNIKIYTSKLFDKFSNEKAMTSTWMKPRNRNFTSLEEKEYDIGLIEKDDFIRLKEDDYLLMDGLVVHGEVEIAENVTFGYDVISKKSVGEKIKSGSLIKKGKCVLIIKETLEESILCRLIGEMSNSLSKKLKFQNFIDKVMSYFVPGVISISCLTFITWSVILLIKNNSTASEEYNFLTFSFIMERAISVLVVSCPCAFGLAIPTVTTIALNLALKHGILIKNVGILPELKNTNKIIFDKTGTLTEVVKDIKIIYEDKNNILYPFIFEILCELEKDQKHPIAEVLYKYCLTQKENNLKNQMQNIQDSFSVLNNKIIVESKGVSAEIIFQNKTFSICIGNYEFIKNKNYELSDEILYLYNTSQQNKLNVCFIMVNDKVILLFSIDSSSDIRPEAKGVIKHIQNKFNKIAYILSGDDQLGVEQVGKDLMIDSQNCFGGIDNFNKKEIIQRLKSDSKILMIGDGINDILSLAEADFGISFNSNSQLNIISSDVVFVKQDLRLLIVLLNLSKYSFILIWLNIFWAGIYNICMLPVAAGLFHFIWKIEISPSVSSFSMLCSSLLIILSANLLRLAKLNTSDLKEKKRNKKYTLVVDELSQVTVKKGNKEYIQIA